MAQTKANYLLYRLALQARLIVSSGEASAWRPLENYKYNKDEMNQIIYSMPIQDSKSYPFKSVTGGFDAKFVMWDFSRGRPLRVVDLGMPDTVRRKCSSNASQCLNPAFVHAITVPEMDMLERSGKFCAVARGDDIVDVIDLETEQALAKSKSSSHSKKVSQSKSKHN